MAPTSHPNFKAIFTEGSGLAYDAKRFSTAIGVTISVVVAVWMALPPEVLTSNALQPVHLLWLLNWCRKYQDWGTTADYWHVSEHYFRDKTARMLEILHLHLHTIHMGDRFTYLFENRAFLVVDATLCPISVNRQVWEHQAAYYSGRHKQWGLKYEIAVNWLTGKLHWVAGGVFGSMSDITLTRCSGFLSRLLPGEYALADKGYIGEAQFLTPFKGVWRLLPPLQLLWNKLMNPHRTIVENAFARIHKFRILSVPFRGHSKEEHHKIFGVIANVAQIDIEHNPLRRDCLELPRRHKYYRDSDHNEPAGVCDFVSFHLE